MFLYQPSTLDRKEDILQWKDHVHLHPVDVTYDDLKQITGNKEVNPSFLNNKELRGEVTGTYFEPIKIWFEILMRTFLTEEKQILIMSFRGLMTLIN